MKTRLQNYCALVLLSGLIAACGDPIPTLPPKSWADITVVVETRPPVLQSGMNEFIVIASRSDRRSAHDLIVELRINEGRWRQAIQDGHVGAYRRAMRVDDPQNDVLFVKIEDDNREGVLRFPLNEQKLVHPDPQAAPGTD